MNEPWSWAQACSVAIFAVAAIALWNMRAKLQRSPKISFIAGAFLSCFAAILPAYAITGLVKATESLSTALLALGASILVVSLYNAPKPDQGRLAELRERKQLRETRRGEIEEQRQRIGESPGSDVARAPLLKQIESQLLDVVEEIQYLEKEISREESVQ